MYDIEQLVDVYEPSEDTFLFIDALEADLSFIKAQKPLTMLEIGSGSGLVATALGAHLGLLCFATDINMKACAATQSTALVNDVHAHVVCMDLARHFRPRMFDLLLFNPPYVVTAPEEIDGAGLSRAWAGGVDGREIIDKLLPRVADILSTRGVFYLLLLKANKPHEVCAIMNRFGFEHSIVMERRIIGEHLYVVRFVRTHS